jgi:pimeloyl-ACP methyl ester carboxylesterase
MHLGAGCDSGLWRAAGYIEPLADSYTCILFDHRGHGESDQPTGSEANHVDRYVADVLCLLDALSITRSAFWAYSNGISVGLKLADDRPDRLWALLGAIEPQIGWNTARPGWNWSNWESLSRVATPTPFLVGELEDPDDVMAEAVALMLTGIRMRVPGRDHINAFLRSDMVLTSATAFLADNTPG